MSDVTVVRYRTKPECAEENAELVRAVFAELAEDDPGAFRYASFQLDDETFVHVAAMEGDSNPLLTSQAFGRFQKDIGDRCEEGPVVLRGTVVGAYRLPLA